MNPEEVKRQSDELWLTEQQIAKLRQRIQAMKQEARGNKSFIDQ